MIRHFVSKPLAGVSPFIAILTLVTAIAQQPPPARDADIEALQQRYDEQRTAALRTRLALYADELDRLQRQLAAKGDATGAAHVETEMSVVHELLDADKLPAAGGPLHAPLNAGASAAGDSRQQPVRRLLKIERALRNGTGSGEEFWQYTGQSVTWSLSHLPAGEYNVIFRYSAGKKSGGKIIVHAGSQKLEVTIPPGTSRQRKERLAAGTIKVPGGGLDLKVAAGNNDGRPVWDLASVELTPVDARTQ